MKFNEKLIEIRKKQGLSQEELGMELQVSRQTISKWETGYSHSEVSGGLSAGSKSKFHIGVCDCRQ